jgi:trigger factor
MQTTLENVDKHRVKVTVEVPPEETSPVLDLAYRHLAEQVKVPGFRKGKVPRQIIDTQAGKGAVLQEFLDHALPTFYVRAIREHSLAPIADPEFDDVDVSDVEGSGLRFAATVEVRPRVELAEADYKGIRIDRPPAEVTEAEVDEQLERLRERFAELEGVGRPAARGDYVVADIRATTGGDQEVAELSGQGVLYEVGTGALGLPELDTELEGTRPGGIHKVAAKLPEGFGDRAGRDVVLSVLVKEVKGKKLPALDDGFAKTVSEFDDLEALRSDVRTKLGELKSAQADARLRDEALRVLSSKVEDVELPDRLVDAETEARVESARRRAERQGVALEEFLRAADVEELRFRSDARAHAIRAIRADLALEAVARAEGIAVSDEDLEGVVKAIAEDVGRSPKEVRKQLESGGQITSLAGDIIRDRALTLVVENAEVAGSDSEETEGKDG